MRRILYTLIGALLVAGSTTAQMRTSYFMEGSYFRTDMNPALAPTRGYIQLPVAGSLGVSLGNNFLSVDNFIFKSDEGLVTALHNSVSANEFLDRLPKKGNLTVDFTTNIIGFGAHTKKLFWNFGLGIRSHTELSLKKDMFRALKTLGSGSYDMSGTYFNNTEYAETYIGFAIPLKEWVTFGFRAKGLFGIADISADINTLAANISPNNVSATLIGNMRANSPILNNRYAAGEPLSFSSLFRRDVGGILKGARSAGAAIDLGLEFRLCDDKLRISAAATDIGFIFWNKYSTVNAMAQGSFSYSGFNFSTGEVIADGAFDAQMSAPTGSYIRRLTCALNVGVEYNILRNHIAFGLLSHTKFGQSFISTELTASVNFRIGRWLSTTFSHTFLNGNAPGTLGFALNVHPTGFNLFVGADFLDPRFGFYKNIPIPKSLKSANVYVGVGFNLGPAKYMPCMQKAKEYRDKKRVERKAKRENKRASKRHA